jgi:hypothetical protein
VEARGGCPARVKGTGRGTNPGLLRIDYPGFRGQESLEPITWQQFFKGLDENDLVFVYQNNMRAAAQSRLSKLTAEDGSRSRSKTSTPTGNGSHTRGKRSSQTTAGSSRSRTTRATKSREQRRSA